MSCCICSKHGFHLVALVGLGRVLARNWKPCLELVLCPSRAVSIQLQEKLVNVGFETLVGGKCNNKSWWWDVVGNLRWSDRSLFNCWESDLGAFMRSGCTNNVVNH